MNGTPLPSFPFLTHIGKAVKSPSFPTHPREGRGGLVSLGDFEPQYPVVVVGGGERVKFVDVVVADDG